MDFYRITSGLTAKIVVVTNFSHNKEIWIETKKCSCYHSSSKLLNNLMFQNNSINYCLRDNCNTLIIYNDTDESYNKYQNLIINMIKNFKIPTRIIDSTKNNVITLEFYKKIYNPKSWLFPICREIYTPFLSTIHPGHIDI